MYVAEFESTPGGHDLSKKFVDPTFVIIQNAPTTASPKAAPKLTPLAPLIFGKSTVEYCAKTVISISFVPAGIVIVSFPEVLLTVITVHSGRPDTPCIPCIP